MTDKTRRLAEHKYPVVRKNWIHNGAFNHSQRGTSFDGAGDKYTLDRWFFYDGAGDNASVIGGFTADNSPWGLTNVILLRATNVAGINTGDNDITIAQLHDDWNELAAPNYNSNGGISGSNPARESNKVTLSFNIRRVGSTGSSVPVDRASDKARVQVFRVLKTDRDGSKSRTFLRNGVFWTGTFDFVDNGASSNGTESSSWNNSRKVFTFEIPYAQDRNNYYYGVMFVFGGNNVGYADFWQEDGEQVYMTAVKLEVGEEATDFVQEDFATERTTMYHYYWRLPASTGYFQAQPYRVDSGVWNVERRVDHGHFPVVMRVTPELTEIDYFNNIEPSSVSLSNATYRFRWDSIAGTEFGYRGAGFSAEI